MGANKRVHDDSEKVELYTEVLKRTLYKPNRASEIAVQVISILLGVIGILVSIFSIMDSNPDDFKSAVLTVSIVWCVLFIAVGFLGTVAILRIRHSADIVRAQLSESENLISDKEKVYDALDRAFSRTNDAYYLSFTGLAKAEKRLQYLFDEYFEELEELEEKRADMLKHSYPKKEVKKWILDKQ